MTRLRRLIYCDSELISYLQKILLRLPSDKKEEFLSDESLQVISPVADIKDFNGFHVSFPTPVKSLIYIDWNRLRETPSRLLIDYGIAHEIGHHFAGEGDSRLIEKEADDLLRKWGFDEEIKAANHKAAIYESKGYDIGYQWARGQDDDPLWVNYSAFLPLWEDEGLTPLEKIELEKELFYAGKGSVKTVSKDEGEIIDHPALDKGIIHGIMKRVKELREQRKGGDPNGSDS